MSKLYNVHVETDDNNKVTYVGIESETTVAGAIIEGIIVIGALIYTFTKLAPFFYL